MEQPTPLVGSQPAGSLPESRVQPHLEMLVRSKLGSPHIFDGCNNHQVSELRLRTLCQRPRLCQEPVVHTQHQPVLAFAPRAWPQDSVARAGSLSEMVAQAYRNLMIGKRIAVRPPANLEGWEMTYLAYM